ncbi:MAG: beta-ketoacyl-ACP synthase III [Bacteroidetes bacterium]|nr:beta-ketoacyl-ACP synthase III [Bacteroidota bacterium]MBT7995221.1 beta-ketoacyl-ACP synthase III [Bacteroidota bacterium]
MSILKHVKIIGTGKYLPEQIITSKELEKKLGLPNGWSLKFSGVKERRHVVDETNADLAVHALKQAIKNANINISDIDLLISSAATFDYILPYQAAYILKSLKQSNIEIPSMDINSSCLSFVSAFEVATSLLDGIKYKRIAIVSSEVSSKGLNPDHKESATLFGDGAAAVILELDSEKQSGVYKSMLKTYPEGFNYSIIKGGGNKYFYKNNPYDAVLHSFSMEGKKLLKLAKRKIPEFFSDFFSDSTIQLEDVDVIAPHQASKAGIAIFNHLYPNFKGLLYSNIETHGNCISASIPMCLHDVIEKGLLKRGQNCLMTGTAAGFAIGGVLIKY